LLVSSGGLAGIASIVTPECVINGFAVLARHDVRKSLCPTSGGTISCGLSRNRQAHGQADQEPKKNAHRVLDILKIEKYPFSVSENGTEFSKIPVLVAPAA